MKLQLKMFQIDAFAAAVFQGNPAAVCPLQQWLDDELLQQIAAENNLSETAFIVPCAEQGADFAIRWFTPTLEVKLCGHATLASAYVLFEELGFKDERIRFSSKSGLLSVAREGEYLVLDFPRQRAEPCPTPLPIRKAFGEAVQACFKAGDYLVLLRHEEDVARAKPELNILKQLDLRGVIITASAAEYDFVCRFFAPNAGIAEDPVTGSAFTQLAPFWAERLGKTALHARQLSLRGGEVFCQLQGERVLIKGKACKYMEATITLDSSV